MLELGLQSSWIWQQSSCLWSHTLWEFQSQVTQVVWSYRDDALQEKLHSWSDSSHLGELSSDTEHETLHISSVKWGAGGSLWIWKILWSLGCFPLKSPFWDLATAYWVITSFVYYIMYTQQSSKRRSAGINLRWRVRQSGLCVTALRPQVVSQWQNNIRGWWCPVLRRKGQALPRIQALFCPAWHMCYHGPFPLEQTPLYIQNQFYVPPTLQGPANCTSFVQAFSTFSQPPI